MKKIIVLVIAIIFVLCPNTAYADEMTYDVYVNHVQQPIVAIMDEKLLLPLKDTYSVLGGKYSYDKKFESDVYTFEDCLVEHYLEDEAIYMSGEYIGEPILKGNVEYGRIDLFDIKGVTPIVNTNEQTVNFLTKNYIEKMLIEETTKLEEQAPELVQSMNALLKTGSEMKFNVNTNLTSIRTDEPVSESNPYKRTFVRVDGQAYGQIENEVCDVKFNVALNQGRASRSVEGFEVRVLDDMLYLMDPSSKMWIQESFRYKLDEVMALALTQENQFFIATLNDYLTTTVLENNQVKYTFKANQDTLNSFAEATPYNNLMMAMEEELKTFKSTYELKDIEVSFLLDGEQIKIIHVEAIVEGTEETKETQMNIAVDLEFTGQGIERKVVSPMLQGANY